MVERLSVSASHAPTDEASRARADVQELTLEPDVALPPKKLGVLFWICVGWLALNVLLALIANLLPLPGPNSQPLNPDINAGPGWGHLLGTDDLGRDILSRLIYGARVSLAIGFGAIAIGMLLGGTLGMLSAFIRGTVDTVLSGVFYVLLAFPALVSIIAIVAFWGQEEWKIIIVLGVISSPLLFLVIRASTLSFASREFITAARTLGATTRRILWRELLPNVMPAIVSFSLIGVATVIITEGALAFLGLSVPQPTASWGNMLNEGRQFLPTGSNPWLIIWPALIIFTFILALNLVGDRLRQHFDVIEARL